MGDYLPIDWITNACGLAAHYSSDEVRQFEKAIACLMEAEIVKEEMIKSQKEKKNKEEKKKKEEEEKEEEKKKEGEEKEEETKQEGEIGGSVGGDEKEKEDDEQTRQCLAHLKRTEGKYGKKGRG
jgi:hypothetical protein